MARPIKQTPILTQKDSENFFQQMKKAENKKAIAFRAVQAASASVIPGRPVQFNGGSGGD